MRIASTPNDDVTSALYALQQDSFRKAGLDVTLSTLNSGSAISAAVAGGAIDIGRSSMLPLITARSRGIAFMLVAPSGLYQGSAPVTAVVVPVDSPLHAAKDLEGKVVSCPALGDLDSLALHNWIDANGGNSKLVQYRRDAGLGRRRGTRERTRCGRDAAESVSRASDRRAARARAGVPSLLDRVAPDAVGMVRDRRVLGEELAAVRAFAQVMQAASAYCNTHQAQTVQLLAAFTKMDPATIAKMSRTTFAASLDAALIQPLIDTAAKYKTIDRPFDARDFFAHLS